MKSKNRSRWTRRKESFVVLLFFVTIVATMVWSNIRIIERYSNSVTTIHENVVSAPHDVNRVVTPLPPSYSTATTSCRQTYFWDAGKAGSTSLYYTLSNDNNRFKIDNDIGTFHTKGIGKEPCTGPKWYNWERLTTNKLLCRELTGKNKSLPTHIINGCPRYTTKLDAKKIMKLGGEDATFLMLIRDPVDRFVSFNNDACIRRKQCGNLDKTIKRIVQSEGKLLPRFDLQLSFQGLALKNLLSVVKDRNKILIIPMESMSVDIKGVVDAVMDHIGGDRWNINTLAEGVFQMNKLSNKDKYQSISNQSREALRTFFREDVLLLENLVGKQFSWSSWARYKNEADHHINSTFSDWIVTRPRPIVSPE